VDAHVHLFPPRVFEAIWRWFGEHAWPVRYRLYAEEVIAYLERQNVERFFALHYAHAPGMARVLNRYASEMARLSPRVVPFGTVLPGEPDAEDVVAESLDRLGHAGLKLHCHVQKVAPDDQRMFPIYEAVARRGKVIVMHAGREPSSPAYGFDCRRLCGLEPVARVVERFPELKLVVPHLGADQWREFFTLCRASPHLYLDTSMSLSGYLSEDRPGRDEILALQDRLLFGTDFPNLPYAWARERDWLLGLGLPADALEKVLRRNALALVGLTAMPSGQSPDGRTGGLPAASRLRPPDPTS
jgi:predicted TIM-barrel fold metal-dependent hydrolase